MSQQTNTDTEELLDLRSLNYVETINSNLICCICQAPFVEPVVLPCGHTYCETCIYQAHEASSVCPVDRSAFTLKDIKPAVKIISNMVNELSARCPRSEHGCGYVGQRQFMESHVKNDCLFTFAPCNMNECKALVLKKDLVTHIATCKYRHVECKMCKRKIRAFELEDHHRLCPAEVIQCPHCETSRSRSEHTAHLLTCPRHPVSCTHADFGCQWKGERQQLEQDHIRHCPYEAIKDYLAQQQQRERSLRDELQSIRKENEQLKYEQSELRQQIQTLSDQLALLFPSHFTTERNLPEEARGVSLSPAESILLETQRLKGEVENLSASLASLELKQNVAMMSETFRLQEELQSLRAVCHGMRMQMHFIMMERRGATSMNASDATSSNSVVNNSADASPSPGSISALNRMRSWLDTSGHRQETKL